MNYATIKYCDIANGEGVRTSLFVSGCRRHCPNCFNAVAWDFNYGEPFTKEVRNKILESLAPGYINGLSLLGGEPFEPENQRELLPFVKNVKALYPSKTIWCYTGFLFEDLLGGKVGDGAVVRQLLERQGRPAPAFVMDPEVTDFYRFTRDSFRLEGYDPLPFDEKIPVAI